jgi:catechol 2,3-dioxygenase-like lactoylglutathione lyase family enzyme
MSQEPPKLAQLNLLVDDMAASLDFYRRLGMTAASEESGPHAELSLPGGFSLELDTTESARLWHAGVRADPASARAARVVIGFSLPSREAVDTAYAELTAAGYQGRQPPFDAFWGGRYAIVADPSGNDVGLMSPIDESMRSSSWPPEESPA